MSSDDYDYFEERYSEQAHKKAREMFDHPPETIAEEYDFKAFFTRILSEKDWTDKLESAIIKVKNRFYPRNTKPKPSKELHPRKVDTKLSKELRPHNVDTKLSKQRHPRNMNTKLSKELQSLLPNMKEVAKAYEEMTTGYKEFIQNVLDAKRSMKSKAKTRVERDKSTHLSKHLTRN